MVAKREKFCYQNHERALDQTFLANTVLMQLCKGSWFFLSETKYACFERENTKLPLLPHQASGSQYYCSWQSKWLTSFAFKCASKIHLSYKILNTFLNGFVFIIHDAKLQFYLRSHKNNNLKNYGRPRAGLKNKEKSFIC